MEECPKRRGQDLAVALDDALATYLEWEKSQEALVQWSVVTAKPTGTQRKWLCLKPTSMIRAVTKGSKTLLLAGCVQRYSVWANFSIGWEAVLAAEPSIKYFHMREARKLEGQFAHWKARDRDAKIRRLAEVAESYRPWTITAWMSRKEHDAILRPISPFLLQQPYFSVFYTVIIKLAHWHHDDGVTLPVDYVFDDQGAVGAEAVLWYNEIKNWQ